MNIAGEQIDLIPVTELPLEYDGYADLRDPSVACAFLLPSLVGDVEIVCARAVKRATNEALAISALVFLRSVRGLPIEELDCRIGEINAEAVHEAESENIGVKMRKCKLLSTKNHIFPSGASITYYEVEDEYGVAQLTECANSDCFDVAFLGSLPLPNGKRRSLSAAFSRAGSRISVTSVGRASALTVAHAVSSLLSRKAPSLFPITVSVLGAEVLSDLAEEGRLTLSVRTPRAAVFYFPQKTL